MAYFETISTDKKLNGIAENSCKLLDFQLAVLDDGQTLKGISSGREILAVLLGGRATFSVAGRTFMQVGGRANVFSGKPHSVYIPSNTDYTITAHGHIELGLCSAPSDLRTAPYIIAPDRVATGVWGAANFTRNYHQILTATSQPDLPAARLIVGETYTPSGNWSTYPPHKHEVDNLPQEAFHEEMYFFKVNPSDGFGLTRYYNRDVDTGYVVRDNTLLMIPNGYHTVASAPGYTTYYLWFLAGEHRAQAVVEDHSWVSRTVPMLRALGH
ncbi:MAG: 5-deoxy-glucuronate isomerase [Anaerolineales bacterium]